MAKAPAVKIEGRELNNVLEVTYGIEAAVDRDGQPTRGLICRGITIRRIADDNTDVIDWATRAGETNRRGGEVTFHNEDEVPIKTLAWGNGYVRDYLTEYSTDGDHVEEVFVVEPEYIEVEGDSHDFNWKDR